MGKVNIDLILSKGDFIQNTNEEKNEKIINLNNQQISSTLENTSDGISKDYTSINLHLKPLNKEIDVPVSGISEIHQHLITQVSNEENIIIGFRPIDPKSTSIIGTGEYSSKGLAIKSKSSDWGPHAGFIPVQQQFAKKSGRENSKKYNEYSQSSISEGKAIAVMLEITSERVEELIRYKTIYFSNTVEQDGYKEISASFDGVEKVFFLKKIKKDNIDRWGLYHLENNKIEPFYVIGDSKTGKAITADYDIFSIIFHMSDLEHYVKVTSMLTWEEWKASVNYDELNSVQKKLYNDEIEYNRKEGKDNGIINKKIKEIKNKLNKKFGLAEGMELIHHGADDANPTSIMNENFPITFVLPERLRGKNSLIGTTESIDTYFHMNSQGAIIINNVEQLSNFQQLFINQGYRAPLNKKWSEGDNGQYFDPKRKISGSFIEGRTEIIRKKSIINNDPTTGKPVVQLDTDFDDVYLNMQESYKSSRLPESNPLNTGNLDTWLDPMLIYHRNKAGDAKTNRQAKYTEYTYNVIIQNGSDQDSAKATAYAFSKHPEDSMIIQYDMGSKQYKILHGDLNRINVGKVRWITIGHGKYYGHHQPTLYMEKNAQQYVEALMYLRRKVLKNTTPDKLVMLGCDLGRGGINENFALKATSLLAENNVRAPIVAYNRQVGNMYLGSKVIYPVDFVRDSVNTKGYKFVYQYHSGSEQVRINNSSSALYFINEVRRGELSLAQLNDYIEPDPLYMFRDPDTRILDNNLIKKVAYNQNAYRLFVQELKKNNSLLPNDFYTRFSARLNELGIIDIPIWKMVNSQNIQKKVLANTIKNSGELTVIIRLTRDKKGLLQAENLAARNPQNTLIFQMDVDSKKHILEYGKEHLMSLLEKQVITNWVIIGDAETVRKPTNALSIELSLLKKKYPLINPENILFHSVGPAMITEAGEHKIFLSSLSEEFKVQGINREVKSKFIYEALDKSTTVNSNVSPTVLASQPNQQLISLLEKIALKEIAIQDIDLVQHPYLLNYFSDNEGFIDVKKLMIVLQDPLVNSKVNEALNRGYTLTTASINQLIETTLETNYRQQADSIHTLLVAIKSDLSVLNNLSQHSQELLKQLFPAGDGIDKGKVLALVTDDNKLILLSENLKGFSELSIKNFEGDNGRFKNLSFSEAFKTYKNHQAQRLQQYSQQLNQGKNIGLINHGIISKNGGSTGIDQELGLIYGIEYYFTDSDLARDFLERKAQIELIADQKTLTSAEDTLLKKMQKYTQDIDTLIKNNSISISDQSVVNLFSVVSDTTNRIVFLQGELTTYTIIHVRRNGAYEICLFDPQGVQFSIRNNSLQLAQQQFQQQLKQYFNEDIQLSDGKSINRGKSAGFQKMENGDFRGSIQSIDLESPNLKARFSSLQSQRKSIIEQAEFGLPKNSWVTINGEKIAFAKLQLLGATIEGKPVTLSDIISDNSHKKIRFFSEKLAMYFSLMEGGKDDVIFTKIFREQLNSGDIYQLVDNQASFSGSAVLKKQFKYLANDSDVQQETISSSTLLKVRQAGTKLPLFQRIANRAGQGMGAVGAIQSMISAYAILHKLDNPDITEEEIKELEKQFYLLCASALFNYGDMIIQPMLLNISSARGVSSLVRARLAAGTVIIFNLVGMGIDIYQAYDSLSKLNDVSDPKQRQDLIVNASLSITSAVINGVTVIAVLVGSSTIPIVGLVVGGVLLVGGWVYNGVRAVENIKEVIDIDWDRELEEGIRGALGLEPTLRTQQEMNTQLYINAFKKQNWEIDLTLFESHVLAAGFDHHLSIVEEPVYGNEQKYYLVDGYGNYFSGILENQRLGSGYYGLRFSKKGALSFTANEIDFILGNKIIRKSAWFRDLIYLYKRMGLSIRKNFRPKKEAKEIVDIKQTGTKPTHDTYSLNSAYKNPLFDAFKSRHKISENSLALSMHNQLLNSSSSQINFYSNKTEFGVLGQRMFRENERRFSENLVNDFQRIALYLDTPYSRGTSWNTANGNDVIIGAKGRKNVFQVLSGEKYFAGGDKDDLFYLRDNNLSALMSLNNTMPTKYLDGQGGNDTVTIDLLPDDHHAYVNLEKNTLHYKQEGKHPFISIAHLQNIENVIIKGNTNDSVCGDDTNNVLDGGLGKDLLVGNGGDDKLVLTQGDAVGGDGNDSYHIRRFEWMQHANDLYLSEQYWAKEEKAVKTKRFLNPTYKNNNKEYRADVAIKESSRSQSHVSIEYSLDEIKQVELSGNDLILTIKLPNSTLDGHDFTNIESSVFIRLENVIDPNSDLNKPHHVYRIQTQDGWMMTTQIGQKEPEQYFSLSYIQEADQVATTESKSVEIDETVNTIIINKHRKHVAPEWGWFAPIGRAEQLTYRGNDKNNFLPLVKLGNYIEVTRGVDTYQILTEKDEYGKIKFDFAKVKDSFTVHDKVILLLPTENGFALSMDEGKLGNFDKFGQKKLIVHFTNVGDNLSEVILIHDKYSNVFKVDLQKNHISPVNPVISSSDYDDQILLPAGYILEKHVIDGQNGDDTIINKSLNSYVLLGGEGDDNIKATMGNNVLYGGAGNNFASGGEGDDLLLSDDGVDTLMGEGGNDHYIIDGNHSGAAYIEDNHGNNHIHLVNFKRQEIEETDPAYQIYVSSSGKILKIKQPTHDSGARFNIHHYNQLDSKYISSTTSSMTSLSYYLSEKLDKAKHSGQLAIWKPVNELADMLNDVPKPLKQTMENDGIVLSENYAREHWLIDMQAGNDEVMDMSQHGRVIKGGSGNDKLITTGGENILYGGQGDDILLAQGMKQDVLISLDGKDHLAGGKGDDIYIVSSHGQGDVTIHDLEGRNQVVLVDFSPTEIIYKELSATLAETVYQSKGGRRVTLQHNNHTASMTNVMQVSFFNDYKQLSKHNEESTIDRLIQLLTEQRIAYEGSVDPNIGNDNVRNNWGGVQMTERFLSHLR
ncbi:anthrax toxin-like adenylyl cyclase domain-containing protein [Providencia sp. PROV129]|uniref:anthrax toxin-like adenylyl cyclase domain-containing protein n=1 Tax=Providencia sp. PROV129 TaxID=2949839 RepID=UPI00234A621D|nr:anthrax toxin-like adenylyl cyclase domain-containing protein [Providencia sp. PROV129]